MTLQILSLRELIKKSCVLHCPMSMFCQIHDAVEAAMAAGGEKSIAGSSSSSTSDLKRKGFAAHCILTFDLLMQAQKRLQARM